MSCCIIDLDDNYPDPGACRESCVLLPEQLQQEEVQDEDAEDVDENFFATDLVVDVDDPNWNPLDEGVGVGAHTASSAVP